MRNFFEREEPLWRFISLQKRLLQTQDCLSVVCSWENVVPKEWDFAKEFRKGFFHLNIFCCWTCVDQYIASLRACQTPFTVYNTLTIDNYLGQSASKTLNYPFNNICDQYLFRFSQIIYTLNSTLFTFLMFFIYIILPQLINWENIKTWLACLSGKLLVIFILVYEALNDRETIKQGLRNFHWSSAENYHNF